MNWEGKMIKSIALGATLALLPALGAAQVTLTAETTTPGSTPHYIDSTLAAVLDSAGVATMQITEGATLTNSVQAVAEGRLDMAPAPLILPFLLSRGIGPYSGIGPEKGAELAENIRVIFFNAGSAQILGYYNSNPIEDIPRHVRRTHLERSPARCGTDLWPRNDPAIVRFQRWRRIRRHSDPMAGHSGQHHRRFCRCLDHPRRSAIRASDCHCCSGWHHHSRCTKRFACQRVGPADSESTGPRALFCANRRIPRSLRRQ